MAKIAVVDDVQLNRSFIRMILEQDHHRVSEYPDGETALSGIEQNPVDLVLLDIIMPGLSGHETLKKIRALPDGRFLPVILISTLEEFSAKRDAFLSGANDYIVRPFEPEELLFRVAVFLRQKQKVDELVSQINATFSEAEIHSKLLTKTFLAEKEQLLKAIFVTLNHEIRNPLTSILMGSQVLKAKQDLDPDSKMIVHELEQGARRIRNTLEALDQLTTIELIEYVRGIMMVDLQKDTK
jgi:two-component system, NtrC family, sensor kinase